MATKNKVKIDRVCPVQFNECCLPEKEVCPRRSSSQDAVEWLKETTRLSSSCPNRGYEISAKGWREKYVMMTDAQYEERFGKKDK